eukprot:CAMPEP_0114434294 /NCGR_PEP_ID=MMETSP0103-20121206/12183_1 /TAXON_ID=37642 ORGANISM="Paraphysomonas imperforata, Strain PA2" /NCGR_SAMPLE_ID=MMETSP0103 /ASSEMBLY_ACC=CAM_ASM_000201 /LENGTH=55 /DNA_ID=CAMNT_0001604169 /DNA_START=218 /DNA_END=385 /DNA_ORIENTATION=+
MAAQRAGHSVDKKVGRSAVLRAHHWVELAGHSVGHWVVQRVEKKALLTVARRAHQ